MESARRSGRQKNVALPLEPKSRVCKLHLTAGITMFPLFESGNIVFAPFVLRQSNWSFGSGKTNGVMPAHVSRHAAGN